MSYRGRFRGTPRSVRAARRTIVDFARGCGFGGEELNDIATAAGEALANALEHGNRFGGFIGVLCAFKEGMLTIEIRDQGQGFASGAVEDAGTRDLHGATRGFGISIMHRLMDEVHFNCAGKHVVRLTKRLSACATSASDEREA